MLAVGRALYLAPAHMPDSTPDLLLLFGAGLLLVVLASVARSLPRGVRDARPTPPDVSRPKAEDLRVGHKA